MGRAAILGRDYVHHRTEDTYRVVKLFPIKIDGRWVSAVLYEGHDGKIWGRPEDDFIKKFTLK